MADSEPASAHADPSVDVEQAGAPPLTVKEQILKLEATRAATVTTLSDNLAYLQTTPVGMEEPLIDEEGFPRSDCDLYAVREARQKVRCARNDLEKIQEDLFDLLNELHSDNRDEAQIQIALDEEKRRKGRRAAEEKQKLLAAIQAHTRQSAFLSVASVQPGSPAEQCGFRVGQQIVQYGTLDAEMWAGEGMAGMATLTRDHENQTLSVWVKDSAEPDEEAHELIMVPQKWQGAGLLGCSFDPL